MNSPDSILHRQYYNILYNREVFSFKKTAVAITQAVYIATISSVVFPLFSLFRSVKARKERIHSEYALQFLTAIPSLAYHSFFRVDTKIPITGREVEGVVSEKVSKQFMFILNRCLSSKKYLLNTITARAIFIPFGVVSAVVRAAETIFIGLPTCTLAFLTAGCIQSIHTTALAHLRPGAIVEDFIYSIHGIVQPSGQERIYYYIEKKQPEKSLNKEIPKTAIAVSSEKENPTPALEKRETRILTSQDFFGLQASRTPSPESRRKNFSWPLSPLDINTPNIAPEQIQVAKKYLVKSPLLQKNQVQKKCLGTLSLLLTPKYKNFFNKISENISPRCSPHSTILKSSKARKEFIYELSKFNKENNLRMDSFIKKLKKFFTYLELKRKKPDFENDYFKDVKLTLLLFFSAYERKTDIITSLPFDTLYLTNDNQNKNIGDLFTRFFIQKIGFIPNYDAPNSTLLEEKLIFARTHLLTNYSHQLKLSSLPENQEKEIVTWMINEIGEEVEKLILDGFNDTLNKFQIHEVKNIIQSLKDAPELIEKYSIWQKSPRVGPQSDQE